MRILIVMQSSVEKLYQDATNLLKDMYREIIDRKHLPIDVISYIGNSPQTYLGGDTLYIACNNRNSIDKHRQLYKYIYDHKEYDVIIKTNVSTVLNLELICKYVTTSDFHRGDMHCAGVMWDNRVEGMIIVDGEPINYGNFPIGFFHMADRVVWDDIYEAYDHVTKIVIDDIQHNIYKDELPNKHDVNDDMIMGALLVATRHTTLQMVNFITMAPPEMEWCVQSNYGMDTFFSSMCTRCKLVTDSLNNTYMREIYEPFIMRLVWMLYSNHNTTFEDLHRTIIGMGSFDFLG